MLSIDDVKLIEIFKSISSKPILNFFLSLVNLTGKEKTAVDYFISSGYDVNESVSGKLQDENKRGFSLNSYRKYKKSGLAKIGKSWEELGIFKFIEESPHYNK